MYQKTTMPLDLYKKAKKQRKKKTTITKRIVVFLRLIFVLIFFSLIGIFITFAYYAKDLPDPKRINERRLIQSTKIYDRTGEVLLYDIHGEEKRTVITFEKIPQHLKDATLVAEDDDFYHHAGIDIRAIFRAAIKNIQKRGIAQGGSTITQQFIKNSLLSSERTFSRKIKETILAIELELLYSKDEILGFYLNQIPYGSNAYGIGAASQTFFGKSARDLSLEETALLASLPKAPTYYSPYGSHPEELISRKNYILNRMAEFGYISKEEARTAKEKNITFEKNIQSITAPHFVMYIREYLDENYGDVYIEQAGLKVITTLDGELQKKAEELVSKYGKINNEKFGARNAALVAIDPATGQILTMVGSVDYFDIENDGNVNVTIRPRQPGSSFKPFAYAQIFSKGYTPKTIVFDVETEFAVEGTPSYKPQNYDELFRGPVTLQQALSQSLNVPSVKVLYLAGVSETITLAKQMGITTLNEPDRYGLSLVLGGGEVLLLDETAAFGIFGQNGVRHPISVILKIENDKGEILEEFKEQEEVVLEPEIAKKINFILSSEELRAPVFGNGSALFIPGFEVAAKTGTTQEYRDAWTVGYTPTLAVGVWVGNNDNSKMRGNAAGVYAAAPLWNEFTKTALEKLGTRSFEKPITSQPHKKSILNGDYIYKKTTKYDKASGKLATALTPPWMVEEKITPEIHSILFWVEKNNPQGSIPTSKDPQFQNWETAVQGWLKQEGNKIVIKKNEEEFDDVHTQELAPEIQIISPKRGEIVRDNILRIRCSVSAPLGTHQLDIFLDNIFLTSRFYDGEKNINEIFLQISIRDLPKELTEKKLSLKLYDLAGNEAQQETTFFFLRK